MYDLGSDTNGLDARRSGKWFDLHCHIHHTMNNDATRAGGAACGSNARICHSAGRAIEVNLRAVFPRPVAKISNPLMVNGN
jgi:hypothetical protein